MRAPSDSVLSRNPPMRTAGAGQRDGTAGHPQTRLSRHPEEGRERNTCTAYDCCEAESLLAEGCLYPIQVYYHK